MTELNVLLVRELLILVVAVTHQQHRALLVIVL